jgi:acetyl/propionyl-CoA carboxylase alpha subunit
MEGHALETRIYAENPECDFLPSSGYLDTLDLPTGMDVRIDSGYRAGNLVETWYDPMLAKLIVKGETREDARKKMIKALKQTHITGLSTNRDFLVGLLRSDHFKLNTIHTRLIDQEIQNLLSSINQHRAGHAPETLLAAASFIALHTVKESSGSNKSLWHQMGPWRILPGISLQWDQETHYIKYRIQKGNDHMWLQVKDQEYHLSLESREGHHYRIRMNGQLFKVWGKTDRSEISLDMDGLQFKLRRLDILDRRYINQDEKKKSYTPGEISAPLNGKVVKINVKEGDRVTEGIPLIVIESMKMENKMLSDQEAIVKQIEVSVGQQVRTNQLLLTLASI